MESEFLHWLRPRLSSHPQLRLGPGDDAAVLRLADRADVVITTDLISDGTDFHYPGCCPRRIGHKALAINLSDLAAMAATPLAVVVTLLLPRIGALGLAQELYLGMIPLAKRFGICIAGGDVNTWDGALAISVTAIGQTTSRDILRRDQARPGDAIIVTGAFGGSILKRHLDVEPRCREALYLNEHYQLHAGLDCSDGLAKDLWRLCQASSVGVILHQQQIPIHDDAQQLAQQTGKTAHEHALGDGEDFELILAVPQDTATRLISEQPLINQLGVPVKLTQIGECIATPEFWIEDESGKLTLQPPLGYEH
jgi:thiamine-monophosphate kinase